MPDRPRLRLHRSGWPDGQSCSRRTGTHASLHGPPKRVCHGRGRSAAGPCAWGGGRLNCWCRVSPEVSGTSGAGRLSCPAPPRGRRGGTRAWAEEGLAVDSERTKVVATLGPASSDPDVLGKMIDAGLDVVRLNFSHGEQADHLARLELVRKTADERGANVAVLADLQGPKIRVGIVGEQGVTVRTGDECVLLSGAERAPGPEIPVVYEHLASDVRPGDSVLLDDGTIELRVRSVSGDEVRCEVLDGGVVRSRKGVNLPGVAVSAASLTAKDLADLATAIDAGVDYVALSFVRRPEDVLDAKQAIAERGGRMPVVAKLERPEAIDHLDDILEATDAVMVARGDLGVELPVEKVPPLQKEIIARANSLGVPVITATQMLESMVASARPTRAEASDVANAIFDGTDAVMLSG